MNVIKKVIRKEVMLQRFVGNKIYILTEGLYESKN